MLDLPTAHDPSRVPDDQRSGRDVSYENGSCADNCVFTNGHARNSDDCAVHVRAALHRHVPGEDDAHINRSALADHPVMIDLRSGIDDDAVMNFGAIADERARMQHDVFVQYGVGHDEGGRVDRAHELEPGPSRAIDVRKTFALIGQEYDSFSNSKVEKPSGPVRSAQERPVFELGCGRDVKKTCGSAMSRSDGIYGRRRIGGMDEAGNVVSRLILDPRMDLTGGSFLPVDDSNGIWANVKNRHCFAAPFLLLAPFASAKGIRLHAESYRRG